MEQKICTVQYHRPELDAFGGRTYNYYLGIDAKKGDEVVAPTAKGESRAIIVEADVPSERVPKEIRAKLKVITKKWEG